MGGLDNEPIWGTMCLDCLASWRGDVSDDPIPDHIIDLMQFPNAQEVLKDLFGDEDDEPLL